MTEQSIGNRVLRFPHIPEVLVKLASVLSVPLLLCAQSFAGAQAQTPNQMPPAVDTGLDSDSDTQSSTYVPIDSWIYPALDRLHALGYLDSAFLGLRPWTRLSIVHMLQESADKIDAATNDDEAREIFLAVRRELAPDQETPGEHVAHAEFDSVYTQLRGI